MGLEVVKFNRKREIDGFVVDRGFVGVIADGRLLAVTTGWCSGEDCYVYERRAGAWKPSWVTGSLAYYSFDWRNTAGILRETAAHHAIASALWENVEGTRDAAFCERPATLAAQLVANIALLRDIEYQFAQKRLDGEEEED